MPELSEMLASPGPRWMRDPNADKPVEWFARGIQTGQQQQQLDQQQAMNILHQKIYGQQIEENSLKIQNAIHNQDYQLQVSKASTAIGQLLTTTGPEDPTYIPKLGEIFSRFPAAYESPAGKHALELPQQSARIKLELAQAQKALNPVQDKTAEERNIEAQINRADKMSMLTKGVHLTPLEAETIGFNMAAPKKLTAKIGPNGEWQVQYGPEEGPTVGQQGLAQKRILDAREFVTTTENALKNPVPEAYGIRGGLTDIVNRFVGQFNPDAVNMEVAQKRIQAGNIAEMQITQYGTGRLTASERERIRAMGPSTGWFESAGRARIAMETLKTIKQKNAIVDAKSVGVPLDAWMFKGLKQEDLIDMALQGTLTDQEAADLVKKYQIPQ